MLAAETDALLDGSGFAFGDALPPGRIEAFAHDVRTVRRNGARVVLLPQALGPFRQDRHRQAFLRIAEAADLIYARDDASLEHARDALGASPGLRLAPDITLELPGTEPEPESPARDAVLVVPNARMQDRTDPAAAQAYLPFLLAVVQAARDAEQRVCLLVHDRDEDFRIAAWVREATGGSLPILTHPDPQHLKGLLGAARLVVASRFHALVGALSHGVPVLATGWSHKYAALLQSFGCPDAELRVRDSVDAVAERMRPLLEGPIREETIGRIREAGGRMRHDLLAMWNDVMALIGSPP